MLTPHLLPTISTIICLDGDADRARTIRFENADNNGFMKVGSG